MEKEKLERGKRLIAMGFRLSLTNPDVLAKSMNVPFVWHGPDWNRLMNGPEPETQSTPSTDQENL